MSCSEIPLNVVKDVEHLAIVEWLAPYMHKSTNALEVATYQEMRGRSWATVLQEYPDYQIETLQFLSIFKYSLQTDENGLPYVHPRMRNRFNKFDPIITRYLLGLLLESEFDDGNIPDTTEITQKQRQLSCELKIPRYPKNRANVSPTIIVSKALERSLSRRFGLNGRRSQLELAAV